MAVVSPTSGTIGAMGPPRRPSSADVAGDAVAPAAKRRTPNAGRKRPPPSPSEIREIVLRFALQATTRRVGCRTVARLIVASTGGGDIDAVTAALAKHARGPEMQGAEAHDAEREAARSATNDVLEALGLPVSPEEREARETIWRLREELNRLERFVALPEGWGAEIAREAVADIRMAWLALRRAYSENEVRSLLFVDAVEAGALTMKFRTATTTGGEPAWEPDHVREDIAIDRALERIRRVRPDLARRIERKTMRAAILGFHTRKRGGRGRAGASKWELVNDLARECGMAVADPEQIRKDRNRLERERTAKGR